jgi:hypothetical protein
MAADDSSTKDDLLKQITRFIPTEVIALYTAFFVFFGPIKRVTDDQGTELPLHRSDFTSRWWFAAIFVFVVTPIIVRAVFWAKAKTEKLDPATDAWKAQRRWSTFFAMLAMVAWISALPDTPFEDWSWFQAGMGAAVLLVMSIVLGFVAKPLNLFDFSTKKA